MWKCQFLFRWIPFVILLFINGTSVLQVWEKLLGWDHSLHWADRPALECLLFICLGCPRGPLHFDMKSPYSYSKKPHILSKQVHRTESLGFKGYGAFPKWKFPVLAVVLWIRQITACFLCWRDYYTSGSFLRLS